MKLIYKFCATSGISISFFGGQVFIGSVLSQEPDLTCFLTRPSGEIINLDQLCNHSRENSSVGLTQLNSFEVLHVLQSQASDYFSVGNYQGAVNSYTQILQIQPDSTDAYFMRGLIYREMENRQSAISDFQRAAQLAREQGSPSRVRAAQYMIEALQTDRP